MTDRHGIRLGAAADAVLLQAASLLDSLSDDQYAASHERAKGASIGQHLRHALDHFRVLLERGPAATGDDAEPVCYDRRERGTAIESDRAAAGRLIAELRDQLAQCEEVDLNWPVSVSVMIDAEGNEIAIESGMLRELAFVTHHAIHHLAMIRPLAEDLGVGLTDGFGRAPSTCKHDRETAKA
ncbi:MAG: DinB family protein [Planctomycetota bacterium]